MTVIRWLGHACFLITTMMGTHILIDPPHFQDQHAVGDHSIPANLVFASVNEPSEDDYAAAKAINGVMPALIKPLPLTRNNLVQTGTYTFGPRGAVVDKAEFKRIATSAHNGRSGADTITLISSGGLRIVDLGDIAAQTLTAQQVKDIGRVDVLILPIGGSLGGAQAAAMVGQLHPSVIIPMLYSQHGSPKDGLTSSSSFISAMAGKAVVANRSASRIALSASSLPSKQTIFLLRD